METSEYKNIYENEETHFFYTSTHYLVSRLLEKYGQKRKLKLLDAGCGTGGLLKKLTRFGDVTGIDFSSEAIKFAKKRGLTVERASVLKLPFPKNSFDGVTSIDVIYHLGVADDVAALKEMRRVLKPNGVLILRVPANRYLMSAHDRHVHTARRYSREELVSKLLRAGLKTKYISYVHSPIFPISLLRVFRERISQTYSASTIGKTNPTINTILTFALTFEARLLVGGIKMPFGQGLIAVASPSRRNIPEQKKR